MLCLLTLAFPLYIYSSLFQLLIYSPTLLLFITLPLSHFIGKIISYKCKLLLKFKINEKIKKELEGEKREEMQMQLYSFKCFWYPDICYQNCYIFGFDLCFLVQTSKDYLSSCGINLPVRPHVQKTLPLLTSCEKIPKVALLCNIK